MVRVLESDVSLASNAVMAARESVSNGVGLTLKGGWGPLCVEFPMRAPKSVVPYVFNIIMVLGINGWPLSIPFQGSTIPHSSAVDCFRASTTSCLLWRVGIMEMEILSSAKHVMQAFV